MVHTSKNNIDPRLAYFACLWALVGYFEPIETFVTAPARYVALLAAVAVLCRPNAATLAVLCLSRFIFQFFFTTSFYDSAIISSALDFAIAAIIFMRLPGDPYKKIVPMVRIYAWGFYFFAFFGKLNSGFINPVSSAASFLLGKVEAAYPMFPGIAWFKAMAGPAAIVIEGLIVSLLISRRTRPWAVVLGLFFHLSISLVPGIIVFGLPMLMLALYFVFLSDAAFGHLRSLWDKVYAAIEKALPTAWVRYTAIAGLMLAPVLAGYLHPRQMQPMCFYIWLITYSSVAAAFLWAMWKARGRHAAGPDEHFIPRPLWLLLFTIPLWLNGASSYLGLKGWGTLTPFSSMRVIGPWANHFLVPPSWAVFKPELVRIVNTNGPFYMGYMRENFLMTTWEFRIAAHQIRSDFFVTCVYQGQTITLRKRKGVLDKHFLFTPVPWWGPKFRRYNPIDTREHAIVGEIN